MGGGSSAKTRRAAEAARSSGKILRKGVRTIRTMTTQAATKATEYKNFSALRPLAIGLVMVSLVLVGMKLLGRYQLWMSFAGLVMIAMSVFSAIQEFKHPKVVESYQDFLDKEMEKNVPKVVTVTDMSTVKTVSAKGKTRGSTNKAATNNNLRTSKVDLAAAALNDVSPAIVSPPPAVETSFSVTSNSSNGRRKSADLGALEAATTSVPVAGGKSASSRRNSAATAEMSSTLNVLHCGTVIDIQGSHGFIIPHNLRVDNNNNFRAKSASGLANVMASANASSATSSANRKPAFQVKMPLVIPFDLPESEAIVRQEIAVGKTVEFAFSNDARAACALNVTPVSSDDEIAKSRTALRSCKQARQVSFARAMEELTMISPRNVPVKHHVDLIKYAEQLDDHELPFDQFI